MNWKLIYDIGAEGAERFLPFVYIGLGLLAVAAGLQLWARRRKQRSFMEDVAGPAHERRILRLEVQGGGASK